MCLSVCLPACVCVCACISLVHLRQCELQGYDVLVPKAFMDKEICTYVCMCVCVYICVCVCLYIHIYACVFIYIYIYIQT